WRCVHCAPAEPADCRAWRASCPHGRSAFLCGTVWRQTRSRSGEDRHFLPRRCPAKTSDPDEPTSHAVDQITASRTLPLFPVRERVYCFSICFFAFLAVCQIHVSEPGRGMAI